MSNASVPQPKPDDQILQRQKELERRQFLEQEKAKNQALLEKLERAAQNSKQKKATADPMQALVIDVEKDLLFEIMQGLRKRKISKQQAQQLAKDFLACLPIQDKKDLLDKLYHLGEHNPEAKEVYLKYATPYFEEERLKKLHKMSLHIKYGNIEQAIAVARGGNQNG